MVKQTTHTDEEIRQSLINAWEKYLLKVIGADRAFREAKKVGNNDPLVFWDLSRKDRPEFTKPAIAKAINAATERNDPAFFIRLAEVLNSPPVDYQSRRDPITEDLLLHWRDPDSSDPKRSWCYWSDAVIATWLEIHRNHKNLGSETVRQRWRRAGLLKGPILIRFVEDTKGATAGAGWQPQESTFSEPDPVG